MTSEAEDFTSLAGEFAQQERYIDVEASYPGEDWAEVLSHVVDFLRAHGRSVTKPDE